MTDPQTRLELSLVEIIVPGRPVPWARAGQQGTHRFTPRTQAAHAALVHDTYKRQTDQPFTGPVRVTMVFAYKAPKKKLASSYRPGRPDIDNLIKQVLDGLNGAAYLDDAQVVDVHGVKWYSTEHHTAIRVQPVDCQPLIF